MVEIHLCYGCKWGINSMALSICSSPPNHRVSKPSFQPFGNLPHGKPRLHFYLKNHRLVGMLVGIFWREKKIMAEIHLFFWCKMGAIQSIGGFLWGGEI